MKLVVPTLRQGGVSVALVMVIASIDELISAKLDSSGDDYGHGTGIQRETRTNRAKCQIPNDSISLSRLDSRGSEKGQGRGDRRYHPK
jgi:hypothetical protein